MEEAKEMAEKARKRLMIVESPSKVKSLKKILGSGYKIEASVGHLIDLPKSQLGVDVDNDFEPKYITIRGKGELLAKLRKEAKEADEIFLATDPDREGEAISWHLRNALKIPPERTKRVTFNEITKNAVKKAVKEARDINMDLVNAQQARRVLDRIVGYKISPLLWKKVKKGLSGGRVQSVALKIICDRENEINAFIPKEYWTVEVVLSSKGGKRFVAKYPKETGSKEEAEKITEVAKKGELTVLEVKKGTRTKKPLPPFTTSTMQQEASKHIGFAAAKTMSVAQMLYEGVDVAGEGTVGLVSYIRTDSVRVSDDAWEDAKNYLTETFGEKYVPKERPEYKVRGRAQDAHEAVRPTYVRLSPDKVKDSLTKDQFKLYSLIWSRFLASQMPAAIFDTVSAKIGVTGEDVFFRASGSVLKFDGFKKIGLKEEDDGEKEGAIPHLEEGEKVNLLSTSAEQHFTQPPARFSEALLVKTLEELGVGRPSTYAPTISTIVARNYVSRESKLFYVTELGEIVNQIMSTAFADIVDANFTAKMEQDLDAVEEGGKEWKEVLRRFYPDFSEKIAQADANLAKFEIKDEESDVVCDQCGRRMVIKVGKFGKFLACPGFPECRSAKPFFEDAGVICPLCGGKIQIKKTKKGRKFFGCENYPTCQFTSWNKPTGQVCPQCGFPLVEKGGKLPKVACEHCSFVQEKKAED